MVHKFWTKPAKTLISLVVEWAADATKTLCRWTTTMAGLVAIRRTKVPKIGRLAIVKAVWQIELVHAADNNGNSRLGSRRLVLDTTPLGRWHGVLDSLKTAEIWTRFCLRTLGNFLKILFIFSSWFARNGKIMLLYYGYLTRNMGWHNVKGINFSGALHKRLYQLATMYWNIRIDHEKSFKKWLQEPWKPFVP